MRPFAFAIGLVALTSCVSVNQVLYTPNPSRVADPKSDIVTLIKANTGKWCITEPTFEQNLLLVKIVCTGGRAGSRVVRLDRVEKISMQQRGLYFEIVVHQRDGEDFSWSSKIVDDIKRMVDGFTALTQPRVPATGSNSL